MTTRKLAAAAAASLTAALLLAGASTAAAGASTSAAVPDSYGYWTQFPGTGPTAATAETNARYTAYDYGCVPANLLSDTESNGVWTAVVKAFCNYNT